MLMLWSKQGRIYCRKGRSIRTTRTVAFQVTDYSNGGASPRFVTTAVDVPRVGTLSSDQRALSKGQKFLGAHRLCSRSSEAGTGPFAWKCRH
jgi:hypothetical protein